MVFRIAVLSKMQLTLICFLLFASIISIDGVLYEKNCNYRRKHTVTRSVAVTKSVLTSTLHREYVACGNIFEFFRCLRVTKIYKYKLVTSYKLVKQQLYKWVPCCCRGEKRDRVSDLCEPICTSTCQNNGICTRPQTCTCTDKFEGPTCEHDVDECINSPCAHICTNIVSGFECSCRLGYRVDSSNATQCIPHTVKVQNFAVQADSLTQARVTWRMQTSFELQQLLTAINIHFSTENSGNTTSTVDPTTSMLTILGLEPDRVYSFRIELVFRSSIPIEDQVVASGIQRIYFHTPSVLTSRCLNYLNKRQKGLANSRNKYQEDPNPCSNGGHCIDQENPPGFTCECPTRFTGDLCNELHNPCLNSTCENGGVCVPSSDYTNYTCTCGPLYSGVHCEARLLHCDLNPQVCLNGGHCIASALRYTGYECVCASGYIGRHCEVAYNYCGDRICLNNWECQHNESSGNYSCICSLPYYGERCEITMESCAMDTNLVNPCQNDGLCYKYPTPVNELFCACPKHAMGEFCEVSCHDDNGDLCKCDDEGFCDTSVPSIPDRTVY